MHTNLQQWLVTTMFVIDINNELGMTEMTGDTADIKTGWGCGREANSHMQHMTCVLAMHC